MLRRWLLIPFFILFIIIPLHTAGWDHTSSAGDSNTQPEEVFLTFNYQNLFNKVVVALYEDGQFYYPVSELFSTLKVPHEVGTSPPVISGSYLDSGNNFSLNFSTYMVTVSNRGKFSFNASQMLIQKTDYYVTAEVFRQAFGLNFSVDFNNLLLQLETDFELPVSSEFKRAREREKQERFSLRKEYYPLKFGRNRKLFAGGFFDYSLSANVNQGNNLYTYNLGLGTEILGGDLQGNAFGSYSENSSDFITDNVRWRYAWRDKNAISQLYIGQTNSNGLLNRSFVGVSATNEPIEPRYVFDEFEIEGNAIPGSEVELYFNDALYDYKEITQNGRYRFLAPLTYGSSRLRLKIFDPAGGVREISRRVQVPFNFLRPGELNYHINAGRLENPIFGSTQQSNMLQADASYGISNWLTQKVGVEYLDQFQGQTPTVYSSTSARLFKEYLFNLEAVPNNFYRISANAIHASSTSWDLEFTEYSGRGIYNVFGSEREYSGNLYMPFSLLQIPFNIRLMGNYSVFSNSARNRYSIDLNTRLSRLNLRMRYSDIQTGSFRFAASPSANMSSSATYYIGRNAKLPGFLEGTFLRGQLNYNPNLLEPVQADFQISKSIFDSGRLQASLTRNFRSGFNLFGLGLTIDFPGIRSSSTIRNSRDGSSFSQNILGSIGFDDNTNNVNFSNRQQVGRAATAVRLFVDNNNSGTYDEGDNPIEDNAVRIGRSGITTMGGDGIIYLSQLQAYNRMNLEINQSAIKNPLLVPELQNFSIVTDPNQYKPINIPFYTSGVISGKAVEQQDSAKKPLPGLRIYLKAVGSSFEKEMRTFNDGTFYSYEIPPGSYKLFVDNQQLEFLQAFSKPDTIDVTVAPLAEGDFIEGLNFTIIPSNVGKDSTDTPSPEVTANNNTILEQSTTKQEPLVDEFDYEIQIASFYTLNKAKKVAFEASKHLGGTFSVIKNTNNGMFAIRSHSISNRDKALEEVITYHTNNYQSAALVLLQNIADTKSVPSSYIQIGAYSNKKRALKFADRTEDILDSEIAVTLNEKTDLYKVFLNESFESQQKQINQLAHIQRLYSFNNAKITKNNDIQIAALKDSTEASIFASEAHSMLDYKTEVLYDNTDQQYKVILSKRFTSQSEQMNVLNELKERVSPYIGAFIADDDLSLASFTERPMEFGFQIQLEGVDKQANQMLLSSISKEYEISHPHKNALLITGLTSWQKTLEMERELSRTLENIHPIVILVENGN